MTSLDVINTDAFLDMPQSSQLLYFHLNARADDDGFVANPKGVMRNCGSQGDDLRLLIAKKFVIAFEDGVCVLKHWRINNFIRKDIYKETKYLDHKQTLFIRTNGAYTTNDDGRAIKVPLGHFKIEDVFSKNLLNKPQNHVNATLTKRQHRKGKVSIDKRESKNLKNSISFLENIPKDDLDGLYLKYKANREEIKHKANALFNWANSKGRKYKNYKSFLENALQKDFGIRTDESRRTIIVKTTVIDGKVKEVPNERASSIAKKLKLTY